MKIRDILALTKEKRLSEIAKDHLSIGEKPARQALKNAGCYSISGKKGWFFDGDEEILDMEIYELSKPKVNIKKPKKIDVNIESEKVVELEEVKGEGERKRASFDLDVELLKRLKLKAFFEDKKLYEIVETALIEYVNKNEVEPVEENELPYFDSHIEARNWFKNKYGDNFVQTNVYGQGDARVYCYDLILNRERYMYHFNHIGVGGSSYRQSIFIIGNGAISVN